MADLLKDDAIRTVLGNRRYYICSSYANSVLQGTIMLRGLQNLPDYPTKLEAFLAKAGQRHGRKTPRKKLAAQIYGCILEGGTAEEGSIERCFHDTYQSTKLVRYNVRHAMPIYVARELDKLVQVSSRTLRP